MKIRRINPKSLEQNFKQFFKIQVDRFQREIVSASQNLYSQTSAAPGKFLASGSQGMFVYDFDIELINVVDAHQIYVEYGTGIYMPTWWSPDKTEAALGYPARSKPRPGKWIGGRGKGSPWTDLAGRPHPGADKLLGRIEMIEGQRGQYRLAKKMHSMLTIGKLGEMTSNALDATFRFSPKELIVK